MQRIEAVYRIVTPMFCGGADGKQAELRAQSVKGMLRFWYRACVLSKYKTWQAVQQNERYVFGDSDNGQGIFLLSVEQGTVVAAYDERHRDMLRPGCTYLGYGPVGYKGVARPYLQENGTFTVKMFFRPQRENQALEGHMEDLLLALKAWGLLGAMGARSRRGFGSVALEKLTINTKECWEIPQTATAVQNSIKELLVALGPLDNSLPSYTAFSGQSKLALVGKGNKALDVLNEIGREMVRYRSYGVKKNGASNRTLPWGEVQDHPSFVDDHDWMYRMKQANRENTLPRRVVFGLPLSFGNTHRISVGSNTRRASPLLIHIQPVGKEYIGVLTLLPAEFYGNRDNPIKVTNQHNKDYSDFVADYEVIKTFMNRFTDVVHIT